MTKRHRQTSTHARKKRRRQVPATPEEIEQLTALPDEIPPARGELRLIAAEPGGLMSEVLAPYLQDDVPETIPVILALVPPDLTRCQCEWADATMETMGPRPRVRCEQMPTVVGFQKRARGDYDPVGAMALCGDHRVLVDHMFPGQLFYREITTVGPRQIGNIIE
jgi:hypothetical protein